MFKNDQEMFALMKEKLYTAVVCDIMDELGYRNQAMSERIRPIHPDNVIVGRAKTCLAVDIYKVYENTYDKEIEAIESLKENEVFVACTNNSTRNVLWGELLSTAAKVKGATGAVIDGLIRDTKLINEMGFPVFCTGFKPLDSKGRGTFIDYDCPVECGGVMVNPGDVIFGDFDGVIVIPKEIVEKTITLALEKVSKEDGLRKDLLEGVSLAEAFKKYGVL